MSTYKSLENCAVSYCSDHAAKDLIDSIQRTEDVRFSPDGSRLAIAGFAGDAIYVFDLAPAPELAFVGACELRGDVFAEPHGLDWFDNKRLAVANRLGRVQIVDVHLGPNPHHQAPAQVITTISKAARWNRVKSPGSLAVERHSGKLGLWVCNNYVNRMSYHHLQDEGEAITVTDNHIRLKDTLEIPDGVTISADSRYMAISNHATHEVFTYKLTAPGKAKRIGQLEAVNYPHGLRFTPDGNAIVVADAGLPYLHVFRSETGWKGRHTPVRHVRVLDDETYLRGRANPMEGGIKGIDIEPTRGIVATTCEMQPLQFFDLADILGSA